MPYWYQTGTVTLTNGSTTVTGSGTAWVANARIGEGIELPDGRIYEITNVVSDTQLTIDPAYLGSSNPGQAYRILPFKGFLQRAYEALSSAITTMQSHIDGALAGRFGSGTEAEPGISFSAAIGTGFSRSASGLAASVNGVKRWLLSSTAFQIDVPVTGTAVQSSTSDATTGRLLKVGAFGLGGDLVATTDFDTLTKTGLYVNPSASATGAPTAVTNWHVIHFHNTDSVRTQIAFRPGDMRMRRYTASAWGGWSRVFDQGSILGTVSQASGVPTGAIIERGSNANGNYIRFADGTQICTQTYVVSSPVWVASGAGYRLDTAPVLQWAASFAAVPVVSGNVKEYAHLHGGAYQNSSNYCSINTLSMTQAVGPLTFNMMAIGRWF